MALVVAGAGEQAPAGVGELAAGLGQGADLGVEGQELAPEAVDPGLRGGRIALGGGTVARMQALQGQAGLGEMGLQGLLSRIKAMRRSSVGR